MDEAESKVLGPTQDSYTPDPGTVKGPVYCGVCKSEMIVKRGCEGPRCWSQAMSGGKSKYDSFSCPCRSELWHKQVIKLRQEAKNTFSAKIAAILIEESEEILKTRKETKTEGSWVYGF